MRHSFVGSKQVICISLRETSNDICWIIMRYFLQILNPTNFAQCSHSNATIEVISMNKRVALSWYHWVTTLIQFHSRATRCIRTQIFLHNIFRDAQFPRLILNYNSYLSLQSTYIGLLIYVCRQEYKPKTSYVLYR